MTYTLIRKQRKSITIKIVQNQIVVYAPLKEKRSRIESILLSKKDWIEKALKKNEAFYDRFNELFELKTIMINNKFFPVRFCDNLTKVKFEEGFLNIPSKYNDAFLHKMYIKKWYLKFACDQLSVMLRQISEKTSIKFNSFSLSDAKTRWGTCDKNGNIRLNWRLVIFDERLCVYIIVHELCHILHLNHSKDFWNCVKKFLSDYKLRRAEIKKLSALGNYLK